MRAVVWYGAWVLLFLVPILALAGIVLLILRWKGKAGGKGKGNEKYYLPVGLFAVACVLFLSSSAMRTAVINGFGVETEYVDGEAEAETELEWQYGTVKLYGTDGELFFEYEGQYKLDRTNGCLTYWESGIECEMYYADSTVETS